jgi:hypothetical protein
MDDCSDSEASPNDEDVCNLQAESFSTATMHSRSNFSAPNIVDLDVSILPPAALDVSSSVDGSQVLTQQLVASLSASLLEKLVRKSVVQNWEWD